MIFGGAGQDGLILALDLARKGHQVLSTTHSDNNLIRISSLGLSIESRLVDIRDASQVTNAIKDFEPTRIYNLAGSSSVSASWRNPAQSFEVNAVGVANVVEALLSYSRVNCRLFQASSSEMFSGIDTVITEKSPVYPLSPYGASKAAAHKLVEVYREAQGLFLSSGILFNHESPLRSPDFISRRVSRQVAEVSLGLRDIILVGDLGIKRDWGWAPDYVEAMQMIMEATEPSDFIVATGEISSVQNLVELAFGSIGISDWRKHTQLDPEYSRLNDARRSVGDPSKIRSMLGWHPSIDLRGVISKMVGEDVRQIELGLDGGDFSAIHRFHPQTD